MPKDLNLESLAAQFDELAQVCIAIGGTFRLAAGADSAPAGDAKAGAKSVKRKPVAASSSESVELDLDTVREKLKELVEAKGRDAMVAALEHVGAGKLAEVDSEQYQELFDKAQEMIDAEDSDDADDEDEEPPAKPAKKTAAAKKAAPAKKVAKKKAGPTLEDVQAAAEALEEADPKAFKKVSRAVGDLDDLDEGDYQDAIDQFEAAMPE